MFVSGCLNVPSLGIRLATVATKSILQSDLVNKSLRIDVLVNSILLKMFNLPSMFLQIFPN